MCGSQLLAECVVTGAIRLAGGYGSLLLDLHAKHITFELTRPEIDKWSTKAFYRAFPAFYRAVSVFQCFESCTTWHNLHGQRPTWITFDLGPGKLKRKMLKKLF